MHWFYYFIDSQIGGTCRIENAQKIGCGVQFNHVIGGYHAIARSHVCARIFGCSRESNFATSRIELFEWLCGNVEQYYLHLESQRSIL